MDEVITDARLFRGQPIGPMFSVDGETIEVGPYEIRVADLVLTLRRLSRIADDFSGTV
jgi:hypothetical protein